MLAQLSRYWWALALRGALAILFGVLAFAWPGITLVTLVLLFGAYSLVDGVLALVKAVTNRSAEGWWALLIEGLAGIVIGVLTFAWPGMTALVLLYLIGAWAIVTGIFEIVAALRLRQQFEGEWLLIVAGIASVLFGLVCFVWPGATALALIWLIGGYAIVFGILLIVLAFRLRGHAEAAPAAGAA